MRRIAMIALVAAAATAQGPEIKYKLVVPKGWTMWGLTESVGSALSAYVYAGDQDSKSYIEEKIRTGKYVKYQPGDLAVFTGEEVESACQVRIIEGENRGREGWIHYSLLEMTAESKAYLAKLDEQKRIAHAKRQAIAKQAEDKRKQAAIEAERKEQARVRTLPKLTGPGQEVAVATSLDCAKDLQAVANFGRQNGMGVEFRKKMIELITLGCAITMANGTPMEAATKQGQFVIFTAYKSAKSAIALAENVRWP